jgi:ubiquitin-protein ligase E3 A
MTEDKKKKFLFFCTGTDRAPIKGLGSMKFVISRAGPDSERLPVAHTCFNHLLLPDYPTRDKMREKLLNAINYSQGFGLF